MEKIENLENIKTNQRKFYSDITLNNYPKSLDIILKGLYSKSDSIRAKKSFVQLSLSVSFFNQCLTVDIETLYAQGSELYPFGKDFIWEQDIENSIHKVYIKCMNRISIIPNIRLIGENEHTNNSSNLDVHTNIL